jgi:hypothetical protein
MSTKSAKISTLMWVILLGGLVLPQMVLAHPAVQLLDRNGNPIASQLDSGDTITAANGSVYKAGPAYSPRATCGKCHDYNAVTKAYHFREGVGPNGDIISDHWSDKENDGTLYKYLANAYGHLLSPGQLGAW